MVVTGFKLKNLSVWMQHNSDPIISFIGVVVKCLNYNEVGINCTIQSVN